MSPSTTSVDDHSTVPSSYAHYDDPLFLSSSDQPNLQLTEYLFNGTNFVSWQRDVTMALASKNKEGFISGKCEKPNKSDAKYNQWIRCDLMVLKWILHSIDRPLRDDLFYAKSSKELWIELLDRYGQPNALELYQLKKDLGNVAQNNSSLVEYYSSLKRTWENIDSLDPMPLCTCGAIDLCSCQLLKKLLDRETHSKLIQLLMGLNASYETVKSTILTMEPLPPINKALGLLQKIERQKQITDAVEVLAEANAYASAKQPSNTVGGTWKRARLDDRQVKECSYCHKKGHIKDDCFKLKECTYFGIKGHVRDNCFKLKNSNSGLTKSKFSSGYQFQKGANVYKRSSNNADVVTDAYTTPDLIPLDPLSADPNAVFPSSEVMTGIVNTVIQQVMKQFSDHPTSGISSANFAGPFK
ncbi:hypothetical protein vseg_001021 [Gypsophila vaccaria]